MAKLVAEVYADALFELANELDKVDDYYEEFTEIANLLKEQPDFFEVLKAPKISKVEKKQLMDTIFANELDTYLLNFLKVVIDKNRANQFVAIYQEFRDMYRDAGKVESAYITSAVELTEEQKQSLHANLEKSTKKKIEAEYSVDPSLIGGLVIRIGYQMIDHSVFKEINDLKGMLIEKVV